MTHLLREKEVRGARTIGKPYAMVTVEVVSRRPRVLRVSVGSISIAKADAKMVALPEDVSVISVDGEPVHASGRFLITTETFDPFHGLMDWREP